MVLRVYVQIMMMCLSLFASAQEKSNLSGIKWEEKLKWDEIKEKARIENKYIFVDCFTTWCVPCKKMDKDVYPNDSVAAFMNSNFLSVRIQMDRTQDDNSMIKSRYADVSVLNKQYKISSYPTLLFFSPTGKIVHMDVGLKTANEFIAIAQKAKDPKKQFYVLLENYRRNQKDYKTIPYLIDLAKKTKNPRLVDSLTSDYINYLSKQSLKVLTQDDLEFIASTTKSTQSPFFKLFYSKGKTVDVIMGKNGYARRAVDSIIAREVINPVLSLLSPNVQPNWSALNTTIKKRFGNGYADRNILWQKTKWYDRNNDISNYTKYFIQLEKINGLDTSFPGSDALMNWVAYVNIFEGSENTDDINAAIKWMEGVVRRNVFKPGAAPIDTYAMLLYKAGRKDEALAWENKALEMAIKNNEEGDIQDFTGKIDKMKKGLPTWPVK